MKSAKAIKNTEPLKSHSHYLSFYYQNVRGLGTKSKELQTLIDSWNCISLTETWTHSEISNAELFYLNVYDVFRTDRNISYN